MWLLRGYPCLGTRSYTYAHTMDFFIKRRECIELEGRSSKFIGKIRDDKLEGKEWGLHLIQTHYVLI